MFTKIKSPWVAELPRFVLESGDSYHIFDCQACMYLVKSGNNPGGWIEAGNGVMGWGRLLLICYSGVYECTWNRSWNREDGLGGFIRQ